MEFHSSKRTTIALGLSAVLVVSLCFMLPLEAGRWLVRHGTYWFLLLAMVLLAASLRQFVRERGFRGTRLSARLRRTDLRFMAFGLAAAASILLLQPPGYKVVMDEPLLVASSRQLHLEKELYVPERCYELGGAFYSFDGYLDKRPGFFPFLLSLMHDFSGYRSQQGLWFNALLTPFFVALLMWAGRALWPGAGAFFLPLLALTVPLFAVVANGSGFDYLNLFLVLATVWAAVRYLREPTPAALNLLLLGAVLLAHTRYESALYVLPTGIVVLMGWRRAGKVILSRTAVLVPLLLAPVLLLHRSIRANSDYWQVRGGDGPAFSADYLGRNLEAAAGYFFNFGTAQPNSLLLSALFLAALPPAVLFAWRAGAGLRKAESAAVGLFAAAVLVNTGLLAFYHWGEIDDFAASRLVLPFILFQLGLVTWVAGRICRKPSIAGLALGLVALYFVAFTRPVCAKTDFLEHYPATRWALWLREKALEAKAESPLFVTQQRLVPVVEEVSAISIGNALGAKPQLALHHRLGTFGGILFVHLQVDPTGGERRFVEDISLEPHFELKERERFRLDRYREIVLSELIAVKFAPGEADRLDLAPLGEVDLSKEWFELMPLTLP